MLSLPLRCDGGCDYGEDGCQRRDRGSIDQCAYHCLEPCWMGIWLGVNNPVRMVKKCFRSHPNRIAKSRTCVSAWPLAPDWPSLSSGSSTGTRAAGSGPEGEEAPANAGQRAEASPLWAGSQLAGGSVKPGAS